MASHDEYEKDTAGDVLPESVSSHQNEKGDVAPHVIDLEAAKWHKRENGLDEDTKEENRHVQKFKMMLHSKKAVVVRDFGLILLLLGWWIPAIINDRPQVRHRWIPSTIIVWFFILLILLHNSRYIPQRPFVRVISKTWKACLGNPWDRLPYTGKLIAGWSALAVLLFGTTYGLPETTSSSYGQRTISLVGLGLIYSGLFVFSGNHGAVQARTTILGIGFQFIIGLFVFRTGAGYSFFGWIATAASDLLKQADLGGATFFWSADVVSMSFFFINTLSSILFFVALCILLAYLGVLQWTVRKLAWFFFKTFDVSGAEAVVAVASPFIGQGENVVLVRPYAQLFTRSEFHQVLTSGFATISGSVLAFYISLGVPGPILVSSSVMSIPAALAASKMIYPETQESVTKGTLVVDRHELPEDKAYGMLHALSKGAWFGVIVIASIFCNVLVVLSLVYTINGILAYIGNAWYITNTGANGGPLSLEVIFSYLLWPLTFMLGVPKHEVLSVSTLIATKIVANEFVGYEALQKIMASNNPLSQRSHTIASYALCGFGNFGSLGINIGVMSAIAPKRASEIAKLAPSAFLTGILVTLSSAAIAGIISDAT